MKLRRKCVWGSVPALLLPLIAAAELPPLPARPASPDQDFAVAGALTPAQRHLRLGKLAEEKGDHAAAAKFFEQALQANPTPEERAEAQLARLTALCKNGDAARASAEYAAAIRAGQLPDDPRTILLEVRLALLEGDQDKADAGITALKRLLTPSEGQAPDPLYCDLLLLSADASERRNAPEKAAEALRELLALPGVPEEKRFQTRALLLLNDLSIGNLADGRLQLQTLQKEHPDPAPGMRAVLEKLELLQLASEENFQAMLPRMETLLQNTAGCDPLLARIAAKAAEHAMKERRAADAAGLWKRVFTLAGDARWRAIALNGLIEAETAAEQYAAAVTAIDRYVGYFPGSPDRLARQLQAAELEVKLKRDDAARKRAELVFGESLDRQEKIRAAQLLARIYQHAGSDAKAGPMYQFIVEHSTAGPERNQARQVLGEFYYRQNDYPPAAGEFSALMQEPSAAPEARELARLWLVQSLFQQREYEKALAVLEQGKASGQADPQIVRRTAYLEALLWEKLGRTDEAIGAYLAFCRTYPDAPEGAAAHFAAAELAVQSTRYSALELFQSFADRYPGETAANALYKALAIASARQEKELAEALIDRLNRDYPASKYTVGACFWKLDALREAGAVDEALALLDRMEQRFAEKKPDLKAELYYARAMLLKEKKDLPAAQTALKLVTSQYAAQPAAARAFYELGDLASEAGKYEEAAAYYRQAGERQSNKDFAVACAGRVADASFSCYTATGEKRWLTQAVTEYETLLQAPDLTEPMRMQTMWKLGRALEARGDGEPALYLYRNVIYHALQAKRTGTPYSPIWCARALTSAVDLLLKSKGPTGVFEAVELLNRAEELQLPGEDAGKRAQEIRKEYGF